MNFETNPDNTNQVIANFEVWCEENENRDVEQFILDQGISEKMANGLREHLKREIRLRDQLLVELDTGESDGSIRAGQKVGRYTLVEKLGQGGMGSVWLASQSYPVRRQVAVKLIRAGFDTDQFVLRFEAERQALALMDHPNIAKVLDAGSTADSRPYFVMEYLVGTPLVKYCDKNKLKFEERLKLFVDLCGAVQHAHQKGIIHRDLKPSNALVCEIDQQPTIKVIDFGLAKACTSEGKISEKTLTQVGAVVGSLPYLSPEQARGSGSADQEADIDTGTDVYSLGAILYELLTGSTPIEVESLQAAGSYKALKMIQEQEPDRPSRRMQKQLADPSTRRNTGVLSNTNEQKLLSNLKGDLDWIVLRAIEKDRVQRYETVSNLARDVDRFLKGLPVEARPPSGIYRIKKFARRNRIAVLAATMVAFAVLAGAGVSTWQAFRATKAESSLRVRNYELDQRNEELDQRNEQLDQRNEELLLANQREVEQQKTIKAEQIEALISRRQWSKGLMAIDEYESEFEELPFQLRMQRLPALDGLLRIEELKIEIDTLSSLSNEAQQNPKLQLWQATYFIDRNQPEDFRATLNRIIPKLSGADQWFAKGINTDLLADSIQFFEQGKGVDPFHLQCRIQLITTLILLGRYEDTQRELASAKSFFPEDPRFFYAEILSDSLAGNYENMALNQQEFSRRFPDFEVSQLQQLSKLFRTINKHFDSLFKAMNVGEMMQIWMSLMRAQVKPKSKQVPANGFFRPQFLKAFDYWRKSVISPASLFLSDKQKSKMMIKHAQEAYRLHPDSFFKLMEGFSYDLSQRTKSIECFDAAIEGDTVFPRIRRQALFGAGTYRVAQFSLAKNEPIDEKMHWMEDGLKQLEEFLEYDGEIDDAAEYLLLVCFARAQKWNVVQQIIDRQIAAGRDETRLINLLLDLTVKRKRYALAVSAIDRLLSLKPDDENLLKRREEFLKILSTPQPPAEVK